MEPPKRTRLTADEFIARALERPEERFELDNGAIVAMAPERIGHGRAKNRTLRALEAAIARPRLRGASRRRHGQDRRPHGLRARRAGPLRPAAAWRRDRGPRSDRLVEVVSPSSRGIDAGSKLASYFSSPGVRHYLIVDADKRVVIHHRRDEEGQIAVRMLRDGPLTPDPPGLTIAVKDVLGES
ncbi:Uma2 family endonuclease [Amaricoccus sp.]|uniref:Uma2 family endonuclease n=1 Tax=Amaricoccus sp. TaxID=1872485 RepID=UPI001B70EC80|nr:Uma2 family endonuclease [Amaricoccus sp.]MBP7001137.1 Uma2 family endonuclease [Amaricoccus sp.]